MKNIRFGLLLVAVVMVSNMASAQAVEQGRKFLYYQRYKSAKETFEKVLASNPNNIDAVYWLGQTLMQDPDLKDSVGAKALYQKALQTNGSAPLLLAGIGNIELREGKAADAKAHFETAISLTKGKDIGVLNAVGDANANPEIKAGDPTYAIEKLNLATQVKNFNNPDTYLIMGDAYRKMVDGGSAVQSYTKALTLDPKLAAAKYKIGRIYLTQNNKEYFLPAFEDAIQLDPSYAPGYYQLFTYWFPRDIDKSAGYFDKFLAVSDKTPENEYNRVSIIWGRKKYADAITAAQQDLSTLGAAADPRYYKLIAYAYNDQGDSVNAKSFVEQYFAKQKPENLLPKDFTLLAQILSHFPGNDSLVLLNYQMALDKDTVYENKLDILKEALDNAKKTGNKPAIAYWLGKYYVTDKVPNNSDLYKWGIANYQAGNFKLSDSIFCGVYESKFPTEIFGFLWCARSKLAQDDSLNSGGLAVDAYEKLAQQGRSLDSVKFKNQVVEAYSYLASYSNNVKKDKPAAIGYLQKILEVDPTNADAPRFIEALKKPAPKPAAARPKPKGK
jgi:tetratricopeptide (TPR) repeat protein